MNKVLKAGIIKVNTNHPRYKSLEKTLSLIDKYYDKLDLIIGPEWSLMNNDYKEGPLNYKEFKKILDYIRNYSKFSNALIIPGTAVISTKNKRMYNISPVFYNGDVIFSTIKRADGGTSFFNINEEYELLDDCFIENSFKWGKLKIGIEICADSGSLFRNGKRDLNLQILLSNGIRDTDIAVKKGGYILCSDGNTRSGIRNYIIKNNYDKKGIKLNEYIDFFKPLKNQNYINKYFEFVPIKEQHKNIDIYELTLK